MDDDREERGKPRDLGYVGVGYRGYVGLRAAKGGSEVGLGSVDRGGVLLVVGVLESVINSRTDSR